MSFRKYRGAIVAGGAILAAGPVCADDQAASPPKKLDEVVVSATRSEIDIKDSPASVSVITSQDIEKKAVFGLDQVLSSTVGVLDRRLKGMMDTTEYLSIRGMTQDKKNLVMVDGVVQNDGYNAQVNWTQIDPDTIERVEVLRGPFSSLYGGNAMGGVISVFTKVPEKSGATIKLGNGGPLDSVASQKFGDVSFLGAYRPEYPALHNFVLGMNYSKRETDGYPTTPVTRAASTAMPSNVTGFQTVSGPTGIATNLLGDTGDNRYKDSIFGINLKWTPSDATRLDISRTRTTNRYDYGMPDTLMVNAGTGAVPYPTFATTCTAPCTGTAVPLTSFLSGGGDDEATRTSLSLRSALGRVKYKVVLGRIEDNYQFVTVGANTTANPLTLTNGPGTTTPRTSSRNTADVQFEIPVTESHLLTVGAADNSGKMETWKYNLVNYRDDAARGIMTFDATGQDETKGLFLQDAWFITNHLTSYFGAREDWWETKSGSVTSYNTTTGALLSGFPVNYTSQKQNAFSPKLSLVFRPSQPTTYRASIGKAFRAPTSFELYQTSASTTTIFQANPDLKPETATSWEVGTDHTFENGINVVATYYNTNATNLIYSQVSPAVPPSTLTTTQNVNAGKANIHGIELEGKGKLAYGFSWFANYSLTDTEIKENATAPTSVGKQIPQVAKSMFNVGVDWRHDAWMVSAVERHVGKRYNQADNSDTVEGVPGAYDPYNLLDLKAMYRMSDKYSAALGLNNALDKKYYNFYQAEGRFLFAELKVSM